MDIGISNRAIMPLPYSTARVDIAPVANAVSTVMPQTDFVVTSMASSEKAGEWNHEHNRYVSEQDARVVDELRERIERQIEFDPEDKALIFRVIDTRNGEVIIQTPNEAMLKLRAFFKEMGLDTDIGMPPETEGYVYGVTGAPETPVPEMTGVTFPVEMYKAAAQLS